MQININLDEVQPPGSEWYSTPDWWPAGADNAAEVIRQLLQRIEALEAVIRVNPEQ
jgi:hypothetical protein